VAVKNGDPGRKGGGGERSISLRRVRHGRDPVPIVNRVKNRKAGSADLRTFFAELEEF